MRELGHVRGSGKRMAGVKIEKGLVHRDSKPDPCGS